MQLPRRVFHLAERSNWSSIERHGLLSASQLMDAAGVSGARRKQLERAQRAEGVLLRSGVYLRDQRPMTPSALAACLHGMVPSEWYATLNARVFFWVNIDRLNRQRLACEPRPQVVLTIDVGALVAAHGKNIALSPINTGNARRRPALRGAATFVPLEKWLQSGWASEAAALGTSPRRKSYPPVELTVHGGVPDIAGFTLNVTHLTARQSFGNAAA
jgi:hypothetical protein